MKAVESSSTAGFPRPGSAGPPAVEVLELAKRFKFYRHPWDRVVEWGSAGRIVRHREHWALRGVSLGVAPGEVVGIIGPNGAGKTTLLRILSRALHPTSGVFRIRGRAVSLLELGTGFRPELTGVENLYATARLLGFAKESIDRRRDAILEFADLGEFADLPIQTYSAGMLLRLGFSLFAHLEPDVYIVDETLAVGDVAFQQKCFRAFHELRERGCGVLLVSHDMDAVSYLCDRTLLLWEGRVVDQGSPQHVIHRYFDRLGERGAGPRRPPETAPAGGVRRTDGAGRLLQDVPRLLPATRAALLRPLPPERHQRGPDPGAEIVGFAISDREGSPASAVESGGVLCFWFLIEARASLQALNAGVHLYDRRGVLVFAIGAANKAATSPVLAAGERVLCVVSVECSIQPGEYVLIPQIGRPAPGTHADLGLLDDRLIDLPPIVVAPFRTNGPSPFYGLAHLSSEVEWETWP
jgi:lipopolysaccharide transport system ATP-binding protein